VTGIGIADGPQPDPQRGRAAWLADVDNPVASGIATNSRQPT
jgi:hypothetical protein